jgi:hypothetical protein
VLPKPLKRGNLELFSFSIVLRRSFALSTSLRDMRRKPPESASAGAGASGLAGAAVASSSTLLCDLRRAVKSPSPGLTMVVAGCVGELVGAEGGGSPSWPTSSSGCCACTVRAERCNERVRVERGTGLADCGRGQVVVTVVVLVVVACGRERVCMTGVREGESERKAVGLSQPLVTSQWDEKTAHGGQRTEKRRYGDAVQRATEGRQKVERAAHAVRVTLATCQRPNKHGEQRGSQAWQLLHRGRGGRVCSTRGAAGRSGYDQARGRVESAGVGSR